MSKRLYWVAVVYVILFALNICCKNEKPLSYSSIHEAAEKGDIQDIKRHLARGAALNSKNTDGLTPLHVAVISGHRDVVEFLIKKGADVNAIVPWIGPTLNLLKQQTYTPMTSKEYDDMVSLLLKHGAKEDVGEK